MCWFRQVLNVINNKSCITLASVSQIPLSAITASAVSTYSRLNSVIGAELKILQKSNVFYKILQYYCFVKSNQKNNVFQTKKQLHNCNVKKTLTLLVIGKMFLPKQLEFKRDIILQLTEQE